MFSSTEGLFIHRLSMPHQVKWLCQVHADPLAPLSPSYTPWPGTSQSLVLTPVSSCISKQQDTHCLDQTSTRCPAQWGRAAPRAK